MKRANFFRLNGASQDAARSPAWRPIKDWTRVFAGAVFGIAFACVAQDGHPAAGSAVQNPTAAAAVPHAQNSGKQSKQQNAAAADNERKRQISDESTQLLALAVALKAEVDKTNKDVLSLNVIRKADQIEKMAHTVKEKMKQSSGPG